METVIDKGQGPCHALKKCIRQIKEAHPNLSTLQLSKKLGIPSATLARIENLDVVKPSFKYAIAILRAICPQDEGIDEFIAKHYPELSQTFNRVYSGNKNLRFVEPEADQFFEDHRTFEFMMMATSASGLTEAAVLKKYGMNGLQIVQGLVERGLLKRNGDALYYTTENVNFGQDTIHKLAQNLITFSYDLEAFGNKLNWLSVQFESVNKDVVGPRMIEIMREANQKIRELLNSPEAKGKDVVWASLGTDYLDREDSRDGGQN